MAARGLNERIALTPWWAKVLVIFVASRVVTTTILLYFASIQAENPWTGPSPSYLDFARIWDGHWYYIISQLGYPAVLPMTDDGHVGESAWAFMPAYPSLIRVLGLLTGLDFGLLAVVVSVSFALGTALVFYRLMRRFLDEGAAVFAVVLFCFAPLSPILQVAYAESMHTFFLVLALHLLVNRQYWVLLPVIAVMALTRPSGLAFALALALHLGWRLWRERGEFTPREAVAAVTAMVFSGVMGVAWLLIAAAVTGSLTAYTDTELAWRAGYVGYQELVPFTPWLQGAQFWLRFAAGSFIVAGAIVFVVGLIVLLVTPWGRRLGPDIRFWIISYLAYLLAVFFPQSSTFRLLVPLFPALGILAQPRHPAYRIALALLFIAGQVIWVQIAWYVDGSDWTPP